MFPPPNRCMSWYLCNLKVFQYQIDNCTKCFFDWCSLALRCRGVVYHKMTWRLIWVFAWVMFYSAFYVSYLFRKVIDKIDQSEFDGFEYVNPLLMSMEDCVWYLTSIAAVSIATAKAGTIFRGQEKQTCHHWQFYVCLLNVLNSLHKGAQTVWLILVPEYRTHFMYTIWELQIC